MSKLCRDCKGAGKTYQRYEDMHPFVNVFHAEIVFDGGATAPAAYWRVMPALTQRMRIVGYTFPCDRCGGQGIEPQSALFKLGMPMWRLRRLHE